MRIKIIINITMTVLMISLLGGCKTAATIAAEDAASTDQPAPLPKSAIAKINAQLGMAYLQQNNVQRAKQKLLMALDQGPNVPEAWYSMAYFMEVTGNNEEANKHYLKAIEVAPKRGDAMNNYGTFLCRTGHYQQSVQYFLKAAKQSDYLDPAAAYENAGVCSSKMAQYKNAAEYFKQALLKDPARTFSLYQLAEADVKLGRYQEAKATMRQYDLVTKATPESIALNETIKRHTG